MAAASGSRNPLTTLPAVVGESVKPRRSNAKPASRRASSSSASDRPSPGDLREVLHLDRRRRHRAAPSRARRRGRRGGEPTAASSSHVRHGDRRRRRAPWPSASAGPRTVPSSPAGAAAVPHQSRLRCQPRDARRGSRPARRRRRRSRRRPGSPPRRPVPAALGARSAAPAAPAPTTSTGPRLARRSRDQSRGVGALDSNTCSIEPPRDAQVQDPISGVRSASCWTSCINGGTIVDGTGAPPRTGDLGVRDGRIVAVDEVDEPATACSTPTGWSSRPASSTSTRTTTPRCSGTAPRARRRCTASRPIVGGNCGFSVAPLTDGDDVDYVAAHVGRRGHPAGGARTGLLVGLALVRRVPRPPRRPSSSTPASSPATPRSARGDGRRRHRGRGDRRPGRPRWRRCSATRSPTARSASRRVGTTRTTTATARPVPSRGAERGRVPRAGPRRGRHAGHDHRHVPRGWASSRATAWS